MSIRAITTIATPDHLRIADVKFDHALSEYVVRFYDDGIRNPDADYFTDDKTDAINTADNWVYNRS